jgi:hypothetical protein
MTERATEPGAVENASASITDDKITISWEKPLNMGGVPLEGYSVTIQDAEGVE